MLNYSVTSVHLRIQIQWQFYQQKIDTKLLNELQDNIRRYQELIATHKPEFAKKAKTHLLLHAISDIERHGPPSFYDEESFEKNHGRIRDQIFLQNQKARSRDTAVKYAQHILCSHVITGGFFKDNKTWRQASQTIIHAGSEPVVKSFLGYHNESVRKVGEISKFHRHPNGHVKTFTARSDEPLAAVLHNTCSSTYSKGCCITSQSQDSINSGEWVKYTNSNGESSYGIFVEGITVEDHGKQSIACIQKGRNLNQNHSSLGCPLYKLECTYDFVPSSNVTSPSAFVHDCCGGQCRVTHKVTKNRIEQQNVTKTKLTLLHNENHNIYLFNHFHL
ncbi:uncharacterized protein LOC111127190 [Crassostrea virginica]